MTKKLSQLDILSEMHKDIKEIKEQLIPGLKIDMAIMKEKSSHSAKIITGVGGLIAVGISSAIAFLK
jgi:hypothetical protein